MCEIMQVIQLMGVTFVHKKYGKASRYIVKSNGKFYCVAQRHFAVREFIQEVQRAIPDGAFGYRQVQQILQIANPKITFEED